MGVPQVSPHRDLGWGYPPNPDLEWGTPILKWDGDIPQPDLGWGCPSCWKGWGYPHQEGWGNLLSGRMGYPPRNMNRHTPVKTVPSHPSDACGNKKVFQRDHPRRSITCSPDRREGYPLSCLGSTLSYQGLWSNHTRLLWDRNQDGKNGLHEIIQNVSHYTGTGTPLFPIVLVPVLMPVSVPE